LENWRPQKNSQSKTIFLSILLIAFPAVIGALMLAMRQGSYFGPVSINYLTMIAIIQQICPFLAAIFGLLIIPFLDKNLTDFLEARGKLNNKLSVFLGVVTVALLLTIYFVASGMWVFYIASYRAHMNWPGMPDVWMTLSVDVFLICIFLQWLYSLYRRWYAAILIFLLYALIVAIIGADQHIVLIGYGTTTPVRFSLHEDQPIGFEAAMMLRVYWTLVALVFLAALTGLDDRRKGMLSGGFASLRAGVLHRGNWIWFFLMGLAGFAALSHGQSIADRLQKITRFYASEDRDILKVAGPNDDGHPTGCHDHSVIESRSRRHQRTDDLKKRDRRPYGDGSAGESAYFKRQHA
jgi:hypothetical protein